MSATPQWPDKPSSLCIYCPPQVVVPPGVELQGRAFQPAPKPEQLEQPGGPADEGSAAEQGAVEEAADGGLAAPAKPARAEAGTANALQYMQRRLAGSSQIAPLPNALPLGPGGGAAAVAAAAAAPPALAPTPPQQPSAGGAGRWSSFVAAAPGDGGAGSTAPKPGSGLKQQTIQAALRQGAGKAAASQAGRPPLGSRQPSQAQQAAQQAQQQPATAGLLDSASGFAACQPPHPAPGAQPGGLVSQFALGSGPKAAAPMLKVSGPSGQRGWGLLGSSSGPLAVAAGQPQQAQQDSAAGAVQAKRRKLQPLFPSPEAPGPAPVPTALVPPAVPQAAATAAAPVVPPAGAVPSEAAAGKRTLNLPRLGFLTGRFAARPAAAGGQRPAAAATAVAAGAAGSAASCTVAVPAGAPEQQQQVQQAAVASAPAQQPDLGAAFSFFL